MRDLVEAWSWVTSLTNLEKTPDPSRRAYRLDRMRGLLEVFGSPQNRFKVIHVAGSKGKGSTSTFLAKILTAAGQRTGLYTSPHLMSYNERITLAGQCFDDAVYLDVLTEIRDYVQGFAAQELLTQWGGPPTTFEVLTLAGFLIFARQGVQWAVVETGLGGRLDATNVLLPSACVLTPIELEHTDILGATITEIAGEKAGIIKPGVPVFCSPQSPAALDVFCERSAAVGSPLFYLPSALENLAVRLTPSATEVRGRWRSGGDFSWNLRALGEVQAENAALAALTIETLADRGVLLLTNDQNNAINIEKAIEQTQIPGRMQLLSTDPVIMIDGAHTAVSAVRLARSFDQLYGRGGILLFGAFEGKDVPSMAAALGPLFSRVIVTRPSSFRPSDPESLAACFEPYCQDVQIQPQTLDAWEEALKIAQSRGVPLLVTGSFYLLGEVSASL